jgi:hypothetical protein
MVGLALVFPELADPKVLAISGFELSNPPGAPSAATRLRVFLTPGFLFGFLFLGICFLRRINIQ